MKMQNILKKTALSAAMLSAVAAPAITHADSAPKPEAPAAKIQATAAVVGENGKPQNIVISRLTDPLELAKQYAPETVEDWRKTLAQFGKTALPVSDKDIRIDKLSVAVKVAEAEAKSGDAEPSAPLAKAVPAVKMIKVIEKEAEGGKVTFETVIPAIQLDASSKDPKPVAEDQAERGALTVTMMAAEAKEADAAFPKAWAALAKAEESKDADAIRAALADLLQQFKQAIAEQEAAAK
ncbi:hypothetical protein [Paenibacillus cookii]|uniref:Uncharacterized protein n=1 Tax=Paenibacillus cookii TaxID=157839 RepID=A0ABQ4LVH0_9BACL|nr:hypothetical protein [Paenibacillus cookii]GIO67249.1 hypothetical protein J21TS3_20700 [Paenibacillus cookii]